MMEVQDSARHLHVLQMQEQQQFRSYTRSLCLSCACMHLALLLASREGRPSECAGRPSSVCSRAAATVPWPQPGGPAMSRRGLVVLSPFGSAPAMSAAGEPAILVNGTGLVWQCVNAYAEAHALHVTGMATNLAARPQDASLSLCQHMQAHLVRSCSLTGMQRLQGSPPAAAAADGPALAAALGAQGPAVACSSTEIWCVRAVVQS